MFDWQVTAGDLLAVVIPVAVVVLIALWGQVSRRQPFVLRFSDQPFDLPPENRLRRTLRRTLRLAVGQARLTVALRTKYPTHGNPFDIHLVAHDWPHWGSWKYVSVDHAEITTLRMPEWEREAEWERDFIGPNEIKKTKTDTGGFIVDTRKPKPWVVGQYLWIELTVNAKRPLCAWVSFEGRTDRQAFARGLVKFRD